MKTTVVNLYHEPYDVYIGRAGHGKDGYFGNPVRLGPLAIFETPEGATDKVIKMYREWFLTRVECDPQFRVRVLALRGKRLGCFCKPKPCHGDVIAEWVNSQPEEGQ